MSLQLRPRGTDSAVYAPARDVVYMLPNLIRNVAAQLEGEAFRPLHVWLEESGVTADDLAAVCRTYIELMRNANERPEDTAVAALHRCGWFSLRDEARIAFCFYLGAQLTGVFWHGVRDSSLVSDDVLVELGRLEKLADAMQKELLKPLWRRRLSKYLLGVRKWLAKQLIPGLT